MTCFWLKMSCENEQVPEISSSSYATYEWLEIIVIYLNTSTKQCMYVCVCVSVCLCLSVYQSWGQTQVLQLVLENTFWQDYVLGYPRVANVLSLELKYLVGTDLCSCGLCLYPGSWAVQNVHHTLHLTQSADVLVNNCPFHHHLSPLLTTHLIYSSTV